MTVPEEESNKVESVVPPSDPPPSAPESAESTPPALIEPPVEEKALIPLPPPPPEEKSDDSKAIVLVDNTPPVVEEKHGSIDRDIVLARVSTDKKSALIKAWEESEKAKAANKAQKKLASVGAWENTQKADIEAELRKIEEKLEKKKAAYVEKMKNKIVLLHKEAEEKRANIEAKRGVDLLKAEELAAKHRATGTTPKKGWFT
ncbi:remorin-like [Impatiens glandulifera]|uniref:remorin-like n=1 Tax=Impatiens glandulifera TaxID=253017 RepID=UPI001FB0FA1E|nr:remorin-like [Impatiens glandulifera]